MVWTRGWTPTRAARSGRASRRQLAQPSSECECTGYSLMGTLRRFLIARDLPTIRPSATGRRWAYRAGTTQAYRSPGVKKLLELPLHVMDTSLFYPSYLNLGEVDAERLVWGLIDNAERIGGALTINWHDRSIAPERLWDDFYLKLLGELKRRKSLAAYGAQGRSHGFGSGERRPWSAVRTGTGMIKVRGRMDGADRLPGLRIRIHKPRARSLAEPLAARTTAEFVDVPFDNTTELNIAL